jgi:hypothetical protein
VSATRETVRTGCVVDLAAIYDEAVTVAVWERTLSAGLAAWLQGVRAGQSLNLVGRVTPARHDPGVLLDPLAPRLDGPCFEAWREDVARLVTVFADLFEVEAVGVRLSTVTAHCQRFHVDRITARMVTTYAGPGTEWVDDGAVVRAMLGHAVGGDPNPAIVPDATAIHRMRVGDVGVFKGDAWPGREGRGAVHRSPPHRAGDPPRLLLTIEALDGGKAE